MKNKEAEFEGLDEATEEHMTVETYEKFLVEKIATDLLCRSIHRFNNEKNEPIWSTPSPKWILQVSIEMAKEICAYRFPDGELTGVEG